jgi:hypothetical protein
MLINGVVSRNLRSNESANQIVWLKHNSGHQPDLQIASMINTQAEIRRNADDLHEYLAGLKDWQKSLDSNLSASTVDETSEVRSLDFIPFTFDNIGIKRTSSE